MKLKVYKLREDAGDIYPPAHFGDVGCDLRIPARYAGEIIRPSSFVLVETGLAMVPGEGYYIRIEPRSSRFKRGLLCHGIIDNGYRGEIMLVLWNIGRRNYQLMLGEIVAQAILALVIPAEIEYHTGMPDDNTERGDNGFGSTDQKSR